MDCIARAELIKRINNAEEQFKYDNMESIGADDGDPFVDGVLSGVWSVREMVKQVPSVTPQEPKTGHWIRISLAEIYECSECGQNVMTSDICAYKYCHGCGARMDEPQESESENNNDIKR